MISPFLEVRNALKLLPVIHREKRLREDENTPAAHAILVELSKMAQQVPLTFNWKERISLLSRAESREGQSQSQLSELEEKLIASLAQQPLDRIELIEKIYGDGLAFALAENRLKALLSRLKRKRPGLVYHAKGRYFLAKRVG